MKPQKTITDKETIFSVIKTGELSFEELEYLCRQCEDGMVTSTAINQIAKMDLTDELIGKIADSYFGDKYGEYALGAITFRVIVKHIDWKARTNEQLLATCAMLPATGQFAEEFWGFISLHLDWAKFSQKKIMAIAMAADWNDVWTEAAKHINWARMSAKKLMELWDKTNGRGIGPSIIKTGKLTTKQIVSIATDNLGFNYDELATGFDWSQISKLDMIDIATRANSQKVWKSVHNFLRKKKVKKKT